MRAIALNRYWNRRMDPLEWKREHTGFDPHRWKQAHRTFLDPATAEALELLGDPRGKRTLELGCGHGCGSQHLAARGAKVIGIDVSDRRCAVARRAVPGDDLVGHADFCAAHVERIPLADGSIDLIFARDVLMYADPQRVTRECHRVLIDGGRAVFVETLEANMALRWFRRLTSPVEYCRFTRHLRWDQVRETGAPLEMVSARPYYLLSLTAFLCLFALRSPRLYELCLGLCHPLDRWLLSRVPGLAHLAWRAVAVYRKPARAS